MAFIKNKEASPLPFLLAAFPVYTSLVHLTPSYFAHHPDGVPEFPTHCGSIASFPQCLIASIGALLCALHSTNAAPHLFGFDSHGHGP